MRKQPYDDVKRGERGMTLLEVLVTLGVLSIIFIGILQFYSTTYKHLRVRESFVDIVYDAQVIMAHLGEDIRQAEEFLANFPMDNTRSVITVFKMAPKTSTASPNIVVVYSLDNSRPSRLLRSTYEGEQERSTELSTSVQTLTIEPEMNGLVNVELVMRDKIAGRFTTFDVSSAYAMRF